MISMRDMWRGLAVGLTIGCVAVAGCASSDGGVGGTGIATIRGNVRDPDLTVAQATSTSGSAASAANILVRVRSTTVEDLTDEQGEFLLEGMIAGDVTLEFSRDDRPRATLEVFVPVESEIILRDVELIDETATPEVIRVENLSGTIVGDATCRDDGGGSFRFRDKGQPPLEFDVGITAETDIFLASTPPVLLQCSDLSAASGETKLRGEQIDGQITADDVRVERRGARPGS